MQAAGGLPRHQTSKPSSSSLMRSQKHINSIFLAIVGLAVVCLFFLDGRHWLRFARVQPEDDAASPNAAAGSQVGAMSELLSTQLDLSKVSTLYVIPGGGTGATDTPAASRKSGDNAGYPEWTRRRAVAAHDAWKKAGGAREAGTAPQSLFLALSAGSLNSANLQMADKRVIFESQHTVQHLQRLGVSDDVVFGDFFSWDTVTNALFVRLFVEGVLSLKGLAADAAAASSDSKGGGKKVLTVKVFISDFHADRMKAAMNWVLGVRPSLLLQVDLLVTVVSSEGIDWGGERAFGERLRHEQEGLALLQANARAVTTREELYAFVLLGGHKGLRKYLSGSYQASKGPGW